MHIWVALGQKWRGLEYVVTQASSSYGVNFQYSGSVGFSWELR